MKYEVGSHFCLTVDVYRNKRGIYLIDQVLRNHHSDWVSGKTSPTSCTWIIAHNIEDNSVIEFGAGSAIFSWCSSILRDYNLDRLLS